MDRITAQRHGMGMRTSTRLARVAAWAAVMVFIAVGAAAAQDAADEETGSASAVQGPGQGGAGAAIAAGGPRRVITPAATARPTHENRNNTGAGDEGAASGESSEEFLDLDYGEYTLLDVLKALGPRVKCNFDVDQSLLGTKVTVLSYKPVSADNAYEILESILATRNLVMVPKVGGNPVTIVNKGDDQGNREILAGPDAKPVGFDTVSTVIVPVEYADATELGEILRKVGSKSAEVDTYAPTNTLIITDAAEGIRRMLDFLELVDVPGFETKTEIFTLEYTRAEILATQLQDVLLGTETAAPAVQPPRRVRPTPGRAEEPLVVGSREEKLFIVPDERLNALIVTATDSLMERVVELIEKLDTPTPYEKNNWHVVELLNARAEDVADALNGLISASEPRAGGQGGGQQAAKGLSPFEKKVQVNTFEQTNALIVLASPQDFKVLREIIARLDVPPRQVHVSAMIMEVVINDNFELAVESTALSGQDGFALNNVVTLANVLANGPLAAADSSGFVAGILDGTTRISVPDGTGGTVTQTIPNVPLLLTALETVTTLDVLSKPSLTMRNNEEAKIIVGQDVPFILGSTRDLGQSSIGSSVFSQVKREEVGIKLTVTPQISEGDYVQLDLEVEVSQPVLSDVGADPNIVGPTLSLSKVTTPVTIKDGATGWIGGLISESNDKSVRQPPILGDLPLIGWLFRRTETKRDKRNLVILVTPHIIKQGPDFERLTEFGNEEFIQANVDVVFEQGLIKRIRRRHYMRNEYSPTTSRMETLRSGRSFGRGDIER